MAIRWPDAVGERLTLTWDGAGSALEILDAASAAYFELTGVNAVADAEAIVPVLYRSSRIADGASVGAAKITEETTEDTAKITVEIVAIGRRCAWMVLSGTLGEHHRIWCWRGPGGGSSPIPEAAKIGVHALDGARLGATRSA